jgi:hypothetical protein
MHTAQCSSLARREKREELSHKKRRRKKQKTKRHKLQDMQELAKEKATVNLPQQKKTKGGVAACFIRIFGTFPCFFVALLGVS